MPLVKRGAERCADEKPAKRRKKQYELLDNIGYTEDVHHSMFRELPDNIEDAILLISRYIVSFLNTKGGILAFGVRASGVIYGEKISRREEDILKCSIDEAVKKINPCVYFNKYNVSFTPVKGHHFDDDKDVFRQVLEIRVLQGEPDQLYEDPRHQAFTRKGARLMGPLTPHQIKDITITMLKKRIRTEKQFAAVLSPAKPLPNKPSVAGEGHKTVAARAVAVSTGKRGVMTRSSSLTTTVASKKSDTASQSSAIGGLVKSCKDKNVAAVKGKDNLRITRSSAQSGGSTFVGAKSNKTSDTKTSVSSSANEGSSKCRNQGSSSESSKGKSDQLSTSADCILVSVSTKSSSTDVAKGTKGSTGETGKGKKEDTCSADCRIVSKETRTSTGEAAKEKKEGTCNKKADGAKVTLVAVAEKENQNVKDLPKEKSDTTTGLKKVLSTSSKANTTCASKSNASKVLPTSSTWRPVHSRSKPVTYSRNTFVRNSVIKLPPPPPPPPPPSFSNPTRYYGNAPPTNQSSYSNYHLPVSCHLNVPQPGVYYDSYYQCYRRV